MYRISKVKTKKNKLGCSEKLGDIAASDSDSQLMFLEKYPRYAPHQLASSPVRAHRNSGPPVLCSVYGRSPVYCGRAQCHNNT